MQLPLSKIQWGVCGGAFESRYLLLIATQSHVKVTNFNLLTCMHCGCKEIPSSMQ